MQRLSVRFPQARTRIFKVRIALLHLNREEADPSIELSFTGVNQINLKRRTLIPNKKRKKISNAEK